MPEGQQQEESTTQAQAEAPLVLSAVNVSPDRPAADTLCGLSVVIDNRAARPVYALGFDVSINGVELPVYRDQLFLQKIPAESKTEVKLFNFWTNETGRPLPSGGELVVEVTLREAQFLQESLDGGASGETGGGGEPILVWSPGGEVPGLPLPAQRQVELAGAPGR